MTVCLPQSIVFLSQTRAVMKLCCQTLKFFFTPLRFVHIHSPLLRYPDELIDSVLETNSGRSGGYDTRSKLIIKEDNIVVVAAATTEETSSLKILLETLG